MAGSKINDYNIGDSNIQSVMLTLDKAYKGLHQVSLTNYNTTSESQIAAGSVVENNGALYQFTSNESITGSPSDGTVYIRLVPSGDTITAEYTTTAPTWSDSKQGWYGTGGDANKRYIEFYLKKTSSVWRKIKFKNLNKIKTFIGLNSSSHLSLPDAVVTNIAQYAYYDNFGMFNSSDQSITPFKSGQHEITVNFIGRSIANADLSLEFYMTDTSLTGTQVAYMAGETYIGTGNATICTISGVFSVNLDSSKKYFFSAMSRGGSFLIFVPSPGQPLMPGNLSIKITPIDEIW